MLHSQPNTFRHLGDSPSVKLISVLSGDTKEEEKSSRSDGTDLVCMPFTEQSDWIYTGKAASVKTLYENWVSDYIAVITSFIFVRVRIHFLVYAVSRPGSSEFLYLYTIFH